MKNGSIITTEHLIKRFPIGGGHFTALNGIQLTFKKGEFSGIVGPSGSGKTTLHNIFGSLDTPSEGNAIVLGTSSNGMTARQAAALRKKHIGFIFQTYNLMPVYTVYENVEFPLLLLKIPAQELSGGECQRVAIARAMVKKPDLVLADEPTANLDAANSHHILQTMENLNKELQTTFVFATHDEKVITYLRRIIQLEDGKVVSDENIKKQ